MNFSEETISQSPLLQAILGNPTEPDVGVAVDMGMKSYHDCMEVLRRNAALTGNAFNATVAIVTAVAALDAWARRARENTMANIPDDEARSNFAETFDKIYEVFGMSDADAEAAARKVREEVNA